MVALDPIDVLTKVDKATRACLAAKVGEPEEDIDAERTIVSYVNAGGFKDLCNCVTASLKTSTHRTIVLSPGWRNIHLQDVIKNFVVAVRNLVMTAPSTAPAQGEG